MRRRRSLEIKQMVRASFLSNLKKGTLDIADKAILLTGLGALLSALLLVVGFFEAATHAEGFGSELSPLSALPLGFYVALVTALGVVACFKAPFAPFRLHY